MARTKRSAPTASVVLPELVQGPWRSLVVLTYGADLTYFESHLLRQLSQVPLRIVLADSDRLAERLSDAAASGQRHRQANRSYLAAPIRHPRWAAHAKLLMLTNSSAGRLLVGSGNLGQDGYATPGELWHVYGYDDTDTRFADEFAAARQLIDTMAGEGLLDPPVRDALAHAWSEAPWLADVPAGPTTVRHNHATPLGRQFVDAVDAIGQPVQRLTVHAPFWDRQAEALRFLIERLAPEHVRVLLRKDTSVDPTTLLAAFGSTNAQLLGVSVADDETYIHAKWVHVSTADRHVLLTGSPNLSRPALLSTWAGGNIEAGVIQELTTAGADALYRPLTLTPIDDLSAWDLTFKHTATQPEPPGPRLLWSQLLEHRLRLAFTAEFDPSRLRLSTADGSALAFTDAIWDATLLTVTLDPRQMESMVRPGGPIGVRIDDPDADGDGPPTVSSWPYQLEHIASRLRIARANQLLDKVGLLPAADKELYELLTQLEQSLIVDPVTAWRTTHPDAPPQPDDETGQHLEWRDIDWGKLRRSGRFGAYHYLGASGIDRTDIEVILASISAQLSDLPQPEDQYLGDDTDLGVESSEVAADPERAEEREAEEEPPEDGFGRGLPISTRTRMAFGRFFRRCQAAIASDGFVAELGPTVTVHNAVILHHVLDQLLERDGVDPLIAADTHLAIWKRIWGDATTPGLLAGLDPQERTIADDLLRTGRLRERALQTLMRCPYDERVDEERRPALRAQSQHFATDAAFALSAQLFVDAAPKDPQLAILELWTLASHLDDSELRAFVLAPLGIPATAGRWESESVMRTGAGRSQKVKILTVPDPVTLVDPDRAVAALARLAMTSWFNDETHHDYWRINFSGNRIMCFWDDRAEDGLCVTAGDQTEIDHLDLPWPTWWIRLQEIYTVLNATAAA